MTVVQDGAVTIARISEWGKASFTTPASGELLGSIESKLGHAIPAELRELLAETNGIGRVRA